MRGDGEKWAAAAGGAALIVSLWAPWFSRRLSSVIAPVPGVRTASVSGWQALGAALGVFVLVTAVSAVAWALWRGKRPSGAWLVVPGALTLLAAIMVTVSRIGVGNVVTTSPAPGLTLAFVGAAAVVLTGLIALLRA